MTQDGALLLGGSLWRGGCAITLQTGQCPDLVRLTMRRVLGPNERSARQPRAGADTQGSQGAAEQLALLLSAGATPCHQRRQVASAAAGRAEEAHCSACAGPL